MNDKKKHYLVYKTTNDLNGMYYIGKHATTNPNDSYLGSGVYLTQEASDSASGKGKIVVHHKELKEVKLINPDELQSYLDKGWERGYLNKKRI